MKALLVAISLVKSMKFAPAAAAATAAAVTAEFVVVVEADKEVVDGEIVKGGDTGAPGSRRLSNFPEKRKIGLVWFAGHIP